MNERMTNDQNPMTKEYPSPKSQGSARFTALGSWFVWDFAIGHSLELGHWALEN